MSTKKIVQMAMLIVALTLVGIGGFTSGGSATFMIAGLSITAAVCVWYGVDHLAAKKKPLGLLMITTALAIIYMIWKMFIEPSIS